MTDAGYRALTRRLIIKRMQRYKAFRQCQLEQIKLRTMNTMHKRIGKAYSMLMVPLFKGVSK